MLLRDEAEQMDTVLAVCDLSLLCVIDDNNMIALSNTLLHFFNFSSISAADSANKQ